MPRAERLERNTRRMARARRRCMPAGWLEKARRDEPRLAARLNAVFDERRRRADADAARAGRRGSPT